VRNGIIQTRSAVTEAMAAAIRLRAWVHASGQEIGKRIGDVPGELDQHLAALEAKEKERKRLRASVPLISSCVKSSTA